jgi:hypothetical protein
MSSKHFNTKCLNFEKYSQKVMEGISRICHLDVIMPMGMYKSSIYVKDD